MEFMKASARLFQALFILATVALSWFAMLAVHELGHVLNALLTGGTVSRVVLNPMEFSRTDLSHNPNPLVVTWGGVLWGSLIPLAAFVIARRFRWPHAYLLRFF